MWEGRRPIVSLDYWRTHELDSTALHAALSSNLCVQVEGKRRGWLNAWREEHSTVLRCSDVASCIVCTGFI
eukprot:6195111-Pleurochrysis_carterae.AAC.2